MANVSTDQAPARSEMGLAAVCALAAILGFEFVAAPGLARAAEAADGEGRSQPVAPAPVATNSPTLNTVSGAPSASRWARVPAWQKVLGVGATLVGLAAVGTGAYLLWLDGQNGCSPPSKTCQYKRETALPGWLLMAGGTAAGLGGVTLLLIPPIGESRSHAVVGLALSARF
jgi:hypothetical protein